MPRYAAMFVVFLNADDEGEAVTEAENLIESGDAIVIDRSAMSGYATEVVFIRCESTS